MNYEYTYVGKLEREIESKERYISDLKMKVTDLINKEDYYGLKSTYNELINEIDNFETFKKEIINKIEDYLSVNLNAIYNKISTGYLCDVDGHIDKKEFINIKIDMRKKYFKDIPREEIFNNRIMPALIKQNHLTEKEKEFIQELYGYARVSINEFYRSDIFNKFSYDMKIECFKDTVQQVHSDMREDVLTNEENIERLCMITNMLEDNEVLDFVKGKYCLEKTSLNNIVNALEMYYPTSDEVFEQKTLKPKEIQEFINAVETIREKVKNEKTIDKEI